jgi:hypothetical protein
MVSPPQKCLKIVALIHPLIGKPILTAKLVMGGPIFTKKLTLISLNNQYARLSALLDECRNAISVFSNERLSFGVILKCVSDKKKIPANQKRGYKFIKVTHYFCE